MLKITYKTTEAELEIESDSSLNEETLNGIMNLLEKVPSSRSIQPQWHTAVGLEKLDGLVPVSEAKIEPFAEEDRESVRNRLPNTFKKGGSVDLSEMEVSDNKATAHHNFRCPSCLQSSVTVVDSNVLIRDIEAKGGGVYLSVGVNLEDFDYKVAVMQVTERVTLVADGTTEAHCPQCGEDAVVEKWVEAFSEPLSYSEFEHPCPICGSETVMAISQDGGDMMVCDRLECGYAKKTEE